MTRNLLICLLLVCSTVFLTTAEDQFMQTENTTTTGFLQDTLEENNASAERVSEMVNFVQEAVAYARDNGKEKALAAFNDRNGTFFRGSLYIYAYDFNGITLAHPLQTDRIGKSRLDEPDANNEYFIRNLRDAARNGSGFVIFHYINPAHNNSVEKKLGYVEAVDDTWWLGSGIYGQDVTIPADITSNPPA